MYRRIFSRISHISRPYSTHPLHVEPESSKYLNWIIGCTSFGATVGSVYGIKYTYDYSYPGVEDIIMPPVLGLACGASFGCIIGVLPPLIPMYGYLTYHHRKQLFPKYFDEIPIDKLRHP